MGMYNIHARREKSVWMKRREKSRGEKTKKKNKKRNAGFQAMYEYGCDVKLFCCFCPSIRRRISQVKRES